MIIIPHLALIVNSEDLTEGVIEAANKAIIKVCIDGCGFILINAPLIGNH